MRYEQFIAPEPLKNKTMNTKIVLEFVDAINEGDIDKICKLMSDDPESEEEIWIPIQSEI